MALRGQLHGGQRAHDGLRHHHPHGCDSACTEAGAVQNSQSDQRGTGRSHSGNRVRRARDHRRPAEDRRRIFCIGLGPQRLSRPDPDPGHQAEQCRCDGGVPGREGRYHADRRYPVGDGGLQRQQCQLYRERQRQGDLEGIGRQPEWPRTQHGVLWQQPGQRERLYVHRLLRRHLVWKGTAYVRAKQYF